MKRLMASFTVITLTIGLFFGSGVTFAANPQSTVNTDLKVNVEEVIQMGIGNCGTTEARKVSLITNAGNFSSCKLVVNIGTNAEGYKLFINSVDTPTYKVSNSGMEVTLTNHYFDGSTNGVTNLVKVTSESPSITTDTSKIIPPFTSTTSSPSAMSNTAISAWGFAVPTTQGSITGFDSTYNTISDSSTTTTGKYAAVPTAQTMIRARTGTVNSQDTDVYFGSRVSMMTAPGTYRGVVLFSVIGEAPSSEGGSGDNNVGETTTIDGETITYTPATAGTGSYQPYQLTHEDTSSGTPVDNDPGGVTEARAPIALTASDEVNTALSVAAAVALLATLVWLFFILFGRRYDVLLTEVGNNKDKVAEIIKKYTKLDASDTILFDMFKEMAGGPLVLVEKTPKYRAKKIVKALEEVSAEAEIRHHKKNNKK